MSLDDIDQELVDRWQRDFPLVDHPYEALGASAGASEQDVISRLRRLSESGALSRIGAVVRPNTVGASTLAALAVPPAELEAVARLVASEPGVNHAYEREHTYNFWFVVTACDQAAVNATLARIESRLRRPILVLPMVRDFHIDLGFSMFGPSSRHSPRGVDQKHGRGAPRPADRALLATIEAGIELAPRPYLAVARRLGWRQSQVLSRLETMLESGIVSRFGLVVRHSAFGFRNNAMVVWDIPDHETERVAARFVSNESVTLCYERPRRPDWRYNLFTMIHARDRATALAQVECLRTLAPVRTSHEILFSTRCFRQCGARLSAA